MGTTSRGTVRIAARSEIEGLSRWRSAFAGERKDRRYYELVEDTLDGFAFGYLILEDGEDVRAVQPYFVVDQDLVTGAEGSTKRIVGAVRRFWPRFLRARTLMVGCAAGEGHLDGDEMSRPYLADVLARSLNRVGRDLGCAMVVLKEFPAKYRAQLRCMPDAGFARIPSMPMTTLGLEYKDFEAYLSANLSAATRGKIRRKLRAAERARPAISMDVVQDVTPFVEEVYPLYVDVYERSPLGYTNRTSHRRGDCSARCWVPRDETPPSIGRTPSSRLTSPTSPRRRR